jgi:hypothetical protein
MLAILSRYLQHCQKPQRPNIAKILKVVPFFPRMMEDQENENLEAEVTKEELKFGLSSFKKTKNLGTNG